jgi:hypothetical protein
MPHYYILLVLAVAIITLCIYKQVHSKRSRLRPKPIYELGRGLGDEAAMAVENIAGEFLGVPVYLQAAARRDRTVGEISDSDSKDKEG